MTNNDALSSYDFCTGVTLVGGASYDLDDLKTAQGFAPITIAADSGANSLETPPDFIIGDMDSLTVKSGTILKIKEQQTTDFEKCLYSTTAPFYIGVGFLTQRLDHTLAAFHALIKYKNVFLIGETDVVFSLNKNFEVNLPVNSRFSIFPLVPVTCLDESGLEWPVSNTFLSVGGMIGTSNKTKSEKISLTFDTIGAIGIIDKHLLPNLLETL